MAEDDYSDLPSLGSNSDSSDSDWESPTLHRQSEISEECDSESRLKSTTIEEDGYIKLSILGAHSDFYLSGSVNCADKKSDDIDTSLDGLEQDFNPELNQRYEQWVEDIYDRMMEDPRRGSVEREEDRARRIAEGILEEPTTMQRMIAGAILSTREERNAGREISEEKSDTTIK